MKACKHGAVLYGVKCINCEREKRAREDAIKALQSKAKTRSDNIKVAFTRGADGITLSHINGVKIEPEDWGL